MNLKKVQFVSEILTEQMNHWMLFPLALTLMGITIDFTGRMYPNTLAWVICSFIPFVFFVIRSKIQRIFPFILLHIAVVISVIMFPSQYWVDKILYIGCAVYYGIHSLVLRFKKNTLYTGATQLPVAIGISFVVAFLQRDLANNRWLVYYTIPLILSIALFFIIFYIQRYIDFLTVNNSSAGYMPASDMFRSGIWLVLGYTVFGSVILLLSTNFDFLSRLWQMLKDLILKFLRFLFSLLPESDSYVETPTQEENYSPIGQLLGDSGNTFWIWELLQFVFLLALLAGVIYGLIKLIIKLIQVIQGRFASTRTSEVQEEDAFDLREKCEIVKNPIRKRPSPFDPFSPTERIRRMYKKKVLSSTSYLSEKDTRNRGIYTAREWENKLSTNGMADVYEQARYSGREMTSSDVKKMKEACKQQE